MGLGTFAGVRAWLSLGCGSQAVFPSVVFFDTVLCLRIAAVFQGSDRHLFFSPLWPSQRLLGTSLQGVLGPVSLVLALLPWSMRLGLPGRLHCARFIVPCLLPLFSLLCGSQASSFSTFCPLPVSGLDSRGRFLSDLAWFLLSLYAYSAVPGVWVLPRLSPGLSGLMGFRFVGLALKVSFPATPNRFCLS